jgi:lipoprotein-anchoring transpeptidase ErfK/SrfK
MLLAAALLAVSSAASAQFEFISIAGLERAGSHLKAGEYRLLQPFDRTKPLEIVVDLGRQLAGIYQGEQLVAITTVSTGRAGYETPIGTFHILGKSVDHRSNLYDAPMPFMQRLTDDGVALHAGAVTGSPGSHGCIHLPARMAKILYGATRLGTSVTISEGLGAPSLTYNIETNSDS